MRVSVVIHSKQNKIYVGREIQRIIKKLINGLGGRHGKLCRVYGIEIAELVISGREKREQRRLNEPFSQWRLGYMMSRKYRELKEEISRRGKRQCKECTVYYAVGESCYCDIEEEDFEHEHAYLYDADYAVK